MADVGEEHVKAPSRIPLNPKFPVLLNIKKVPSHAVHHVSAMLAMPQIRFERTSTTNTFDWNIGWIDKCSREFFLSLKIHQKVNHMPGVEQLSRKKCLTKCISQMVDARPEDFSIAPRSWTFPQGYPQFVAAFKAQREEEVRRKVEYEQALATYQAEVERLRCAGDVAAADALVAPTPPPKPMSYIVKPGSACQGRGIYLAMELDQIKKQAGNVVQEYIANPLLINKKKFDLRIYVLVTSISPLRIYLYRDGLARFCTEDYLEPDDTNIKQLFGHLTNFTLNKANAKFVHNEDEEETQGEGSKWTLEGFNEHMEKVYGRETLQLVWQRIHDVLIKTILVTYPVMEGGYRALYPRDTYGAHCFQLLGFDIMLDSNLRPWLIEVNRNPSLRCDAPLDQRIKSQLLGQTFYLLDPASYLRPIRDASKAVHNVLVAKLQSQEGDQLDLQSEDRASSGDAESSSMSLEKVLEAAAQTAVELGITSVQSKSPDNLRAQELADRIGIPKPYGLHHMPRPLARRLLVDRSDLAFYQSRRAAYELTMRLAHEDRVVSELVRKSHTEPSQGHLDYLETAKANPPAKHTTGLRAPKVRMHKDEDGYPHFERGWQRLFPVPAFADYPAADLIPDDMDNLVPYPDLCAEELVAARLARLGLDSEAKSSSVEDKSSTTLATPAEEVKSVTTGSPSHKHIMFSNLPYEEAQSRHAYYKELIESVKERSQPWVASAISESLSARMGVTSLGMSQLRPRVPPVTQEGTVDGQSMANSTVDSANATSAISATPQIDDDYGGILTTAAGIKSKSRRRGNQGLRVLTRQLGRTNLGTDGFDSSEGSRSASSAEASSPSQI